LSWQTILCPYTLYPIYEYYGNNGEKTTITMGRL